MLAWLATPWQGLAPGAEFNSVALRLVASCLLAFLLALLGTAWARRARPWPAVSIGTAQVSGLAGILVGLCVNWLLPDWSGAIGVGLLLPLLLLDLWPASRCPHPATVHASRPPWSGHGSPQDFPQLRQGIIQNAQAGWWWSWLANRGRLSSTLLGSGVAVIATSVWSVVPTLYAWQLARAQSLGILLWLLCGQLFALLLLSGALHTRVISRLMREESRSVVPSRSRPVFLSGA